MDNRHRGPRRDRQDLWRRRALTLVLILFTAVTMLANPTPWTAKVVGQEEEGAFVSLEAKLNEKGTIMLRDASLVAWLFAIQKEWGVDIVVGNELERDVVNGAFTDTTLRAVLTSILYSRGYGYRQVGKSLLIMRLDDMTIKPDQRPILIPLDLLDPQEVEASVQLLLSQTEQIQSIPSSKSLFIIDSPEVIERVRRFLSELEEHARGSRERDQARLQSERAATAALANPNGTGTAGAGGGAAGVDVVEIVEHTKIFRLQYVTADAVAEVVGNVLPDARATPIADDGKIVITANDESLTSAAELIAQLDRPRKQVRITAYMYDVNVEVMETLGFNWSNAGRGRINGSGDPQSIFNFDSNSFQTTSPAAAATAAGGGTAAPTDPLAGGTDPTATAATVAAPVVVGLLTFGHLSRHFDLTSTIQTLERTDGARLLARPNIVAYDRVQASFESVQEIPVQQLTQTSEGGNIGTTEFREAGITLTVTPEIMIDNSILLQVTPEFSVLNGFNNGQPIIDRRSATMRLQLVDGQAAIIGGLVRRNEIESDSGVPGIMHWKYFGRLFRGHQATVTESELVVFIRAEVIDASFPGDPRDQMAHSTVEEMLNQIPYANPAPVVATCADPYCPYHNPRPRFTGDYPADYKHGHGHQYQTPTQTYQHGEPYQQGTEWAPSEPLPAVNMQLPPATSPDLPPPPEPPASTTPAPPEDGRNSVHIPPPVFIDEMARRFRNGRVAMRRLPSVNREGSRQAQQQAPIVVLPNRQAAAPFNPSRLPYHRTANAGGGMLPLPPTQPQPRSASSPPRKNWLENLFQR